MDLFRSFENMGMKVDDDWHMFVLQHLSIPRIQEDLDLFKKIMLCLLNRIERPYNCCCYVGIQ